MNSNTVYQIQYHYFNEEIISESLTIQVKLVHILSTNKVYDDNEWQLNVWNVGKEYQLWMMFDSQINDYYK